jgi:hypothetical protein
MLLRKKDRVIKISEEQTPYGHGGVRKGTGGVKPTLSSSSAYCRVGCIKLLSYHVEVKANYGNISN